MKAALKKAESAENIIESNARGLDKVQQGSNEERALYAQILEQYDIWIQEKTLAEAALQEMARMDTTVYGLRLNHTTVTVQRAMSKTYKHFEEKDQDDNWETANNTMGGEYDNEGNRYSSDDDQNQELNATDDIPSKKFSTPFNTIPIPPERKSSTVGFDLGQDTFARGLGGDKTRTKRNRYLGSMKSQSLAGWDEQSFLDQNTLLDNLSTRKQKKVSWDDFYSKNHTKRYYCPNEKRVGNEYKHRVTFSGRNPADWPQTRKIITTMILNRRYMDFDEKDSKK
jgi:hypothetical protein